MFKFKDYQPLINQILKKNQELKMAAELGRKMLEENDGLRGMYSELEHEHEKTVKVRGWAFFSTNK